MVSMAYDLTSTATHRSYETLESLREVGEALWEAARAALGAADAVNPAPFDGLPSIDDGRIVDVVAERYAVLAEYVARRKAAWDHMEKFGDAFVAFHKRCSGGIAAWNEKNCEPLMRWFIDDLFGKHVKAVSNGHLVVKDRLRAQKEMDDGFNRLRTYPNQSAFKEKKKAIDDALQNTTLETPLPVLSKSPRLPRGDVRIPFDDFQARLPALSRSPRLPRGDDRVPFDDLQARLSKSPRLPRGDDRVPFDDFQARLPALERSPRLPRGDDRVPFDDLQERLSKSLRLPRGEDRIPFDDFQARLPALSRSSKLARGDDRAPFDDFDSDSEDHFSFYDPDQPRVEAPELGRRMTSDEIAAATYDRAVPGPRGRMLYPGDHEIDEEQRVDMSPMKERGASPKKSVRISDAVSPVKGEYVNEHGRTVYFQGGGSLSSWTAHFALAAVVVTAAFMG